MAHSVYIYQKAKKPFSIEAEIPLQTASGHQRWKNNSFFSWRSKRLLCCIEPYFFSAFLCVVHAFVHSVWHPMTSFHTCQSHFCFGATQYIVPFIWFQQIFFDLPRRELLFSIFCDNLHRMLIFPTHVLFTLLAYFSMRDRTLDIGENPSHNGENPTLDDITTRFFARPRGLDVNKWHAVASGRSSSLPGTYFALYFAFGVFDFGVLASFIALLPGVLLGVFELVLTEDFGVLGIRSSGAFDVFGVDGVLLL